MTIEEAKDKLFGLNKEYMKKSPKERLKSYDEYKSQRMQVQEELKIYIEETKENVKTKGQLLS